MGRKEKRLTHARVVPGLVSGLSVDVDEGGDKADGENNREQVHQCPNAWERAWPIVDVISRRPAIPTVTPTMVFTAARAPAPTKKVRPESTSEVINNTGHAIATITTAHQPSRPAASPASRPIKMAMGIM